MLYTKFETEKIFKGCKNIDEVMRVSGCFAFLVKEGVEVPLCVPTLAHLKIREISR